MVGVQTPDSAFPGAAGAVERIARAKTDTQYLIQQGFTGYNATHWVGANALARRSALDAIVEFEVERGFAIRRYIQDRTVIEDSESTIDLVSKGWPARIRTGQIDSRFEHQCRQSDADKSAGLPIWTTAGHPRVGALDCAPSIPAARRVSGSDSE